MFLDRWYIKSYIGLFLLVVVGACQVGSANEDDNIPAYLADLEIAQFHQIYPLLEERALGWDPQAGLDGWTIQLHPTEETGYRDVFAVFDSPNKDRRLIIEHHVNGEVTVRPSQFTESSTARDNFIENIHKLIDSTEAWAIFFQHPDVLAHSEEDFYCAELILVPNLQGDAFFWRLMIPNGCPNDGAEFYLINAVSGEWTEPSQGTPFP